MFLTSCAAASTAPMVLDFCTRTIQPEVFNVCIPVDSSLDLASIHGYHHSITLSFSAASLSLCCLKLKLNVFNIMCSRTDDSFVIRLPHTNGSVWGSWALIPVDSLAERPVSRNKKRGVLAYGNTLQDRHRCLLAA